MQRPYEILRLTCLLTAVCGGIAACRAAEDAPDDADSQAIRSAAQDYLVAMRSGDADKLRATWTADGDYVDATGQSFKAHELINQIAPIGESATEPAEAEPAEADPGESTLRFIAPDVAIEDGASGYFNSEVGSELTGRFAAIWVKRDGKWLLDSLRESASAAPPGHPKLRPLDWLVGEWTGATGAAAILTSWQWTDGGNFLVGEFLIYGQGREAVGGTQRIGWDPVSRQIKSWIFDSQGSMGEGRWRRDGNRWLVESTHVTADGKKSKTTASYSPGEAEKFLLEVASEWDSPEANPAGGKLPAQRFEFRRAAGDQ